MIGTKPQARGGACGCGGTPFSIRPEKGKPGRISNVLLQSLIQSDSAWGNKPGNRMAERQGP